MCASLIRDPRPNNQILQHNFLDDAFLHGGTAQHIADALQAQFPGRQPADYLERVRGHAQHLTQTTQDANDPQHGVGAIPQTPRIRDEIDGATFLKLIPPLSAGETWEEYLQHRDANVLAGNLPTIEGDGAGWRLEWMNP
jgi:hypothetical protein